MQKLEKNNLYKVCCHSLAFQLIPLFAFILEMGMNNVVGAKNLMKLILGPSEMWTIDHSEEIPDIDPKQVDQKIALELPEFKTVVEEFKSWSQNETTKSEFQVTADNNSVDGQSVEVTFLGTGAALPSKYRNGIFPTK